MKNQENQNNTNDNTNKNTNRRKYIIGGVIVVVLSIIIIIAAVIIPNFNDNDSEPVFNETTPTPVVTNEVTPTVEPTIVPTVEPTQAIEDVIDSIPVAPEPEVTEAPVKETNNEDAEAVFEEDPNKEVEPTETPTETVEPTKPVEETKPTPTEKPTEPTKKPEKPTTTPKPTEVPKKDNETSYDGTTTIGGVKIPKLDGFASAPLTNGDGLWGSDTLDDLVLEEALKDYSTQMKADIIALNDESNAGLTSQLAVKDTSISAEINGDSSLSSISLSKENDHYEIYLATSLTYTSTDKELGNANYTEITNNVLRLLCNIVTSDGNLLYNTIYKAYEEDSSIISKNSYTTFGNFQIKYRVENGHGVIFSIKSK